MWRDRLPGLDNKREIRLTIFRQRRWYTNITASTSLIRLKSVDAENFPDIDQLGDG